MKIRFRIGDLSRDGHNMSEDLFFEVNSTPSELRDGYYASEKLTGVRFKDEVADDYEDRSMSPEIFRKFMAYPSFEAYIRTTWDYLEKEEVDKLIADWSREGEDNFWFDDVDQYVALLLWFISLSLPGLTYEGVTNNSIPTLNLGNLGYGLFSS